MYHIAKALKKFHLYVNNEFFNEHFDALPLCMGHIGWKINYYLTDPQDFSESYFKETFLFFTYHNIGCTFSSICFIFGGLIFT